MNNTDGKKMLREMREMIRTQNTSAGDENNLPHQAGIKLFVNEEFEDAAEVFRQAVKLNPDFAFSHYYLGRCLRRLGKYAEAVDAFQQALKLNPLHAPSYAHLGDVFLQQDDFAQAERCFRRAIFFQFDNLTALSGLVKLAEKKYVAMVEAAELLKDAYFRGAKNPLLLMELFSFQAPEAEFCLHIADELSLRRSYHRALFFYRLALRESPGNIDAELKATETLQHLNRPEISVTDISG